MKRPSLLALVPFAFLFLLSIVSVRPVWARASLENPQPNSAQSGIGLISGWACDANRIEIIFNETDTQQAGYGTRRTDTQGVCGDTNNGFGLLFNWNRLGDGTHTVRALADGVEFGSATFTVTTLGKEVLRGANAAVTVSDFPTAGSDIVLRWQESQQNFVITAGSPGSGGTSGSPPRVLENPQPGSFQSGVGVISGWVCDANQIEIEFNNDAANRWPAGYRTQRTDTQDICGDTDNGFGLLFNWNKLGAGTHTVRALADGTEFARATVTVTTLGEEFRRGLSREVTVPDFPEVGTDTVVQWQEAQQNFVISFTAPTSRLVDVTPTLTLPPGTNIRDADVDITSVYSATTPEVLAAPVPTLLLAEDAGGLVLLGLADQDGGFLGEAAGEVGVSIESTAVVLVALAAGYRLPEVDQALVDAMRAQPGWPALLAALRDEQAADPNFLDQPEVPPAVLAQIVALGTAVSREPSAAAQGAAPLAAAQSSNVLPYGVVHNDFPADGPWHAAQPWVWFGEALGTPFLASVPSLSSPFLAASQRFPSLTAAGNPNFVAYALEVYDADGTLVAWHLVTGNGSRAERERNSSAAYHPYRLMPGDTRVAFQRYRLEFGTEQAAAVSIQNNLMLFIPALEIIATVSGVEALLKRLKLKENAAVLGQCAAKGSLTLLEKPDLDSVTNFVKTHGPKFFQAIAECTAFKDKLKKQGNKALSDTLILIANAKNAALGFAKVAGGWLNKIAKAVTIAKTVWNDVLPIANSYVMPAAGSVDYHLCWSGDRLDQVHEYAPGRNPCPSGPGGSSDIHVLLRIKDRLGLWNNWGTDTPLSMWTGVTFDSGRVVRLRLDPYGAARKIIPEELGELTGLRDLRLRQAWGIPWIGPIPETLGKLANLERLDLRANNLSGSIPAALGQLANLKWLDLGANNLSGSIPAALGQLAKLQGLLLFNNQLTGSIPSALGQLENLTSLEFANNQLTGSIPPALGQLANLWTLDLRNNQLIGSIPSALGQLTKLRELLLFNNQLTGSIPSALGQLENLETLNLSWNKLGGGLPHRDLLPPRLGKFFVRGNQLTGELPDSWKDWTGSSWDIRDNNLEGCIPVWAFGHHINPQRDGRDLPPC